MKSSVSEPGLSYPKVDSDPLKVAIAKGCLIQPRPSLRSKRFRLF